MHGPPGLSGNVPGWGAGNAMGPADRVEERARLLPKAKQISVGVGRELVARARFRSCTALCIGFPHGELGPPSCPVRPLGSRCEATSAQGSATGGSSERALLPLAAPDTCYYSIGKEALSVTIAAGPGDRPVVPRAASVFSAWLPATAGFHERMSQ